MHGGSIPQRDKVRAMMQVSMAHLQLMIDSPLYLQELNPLRNRSHFRAIRFDTRVLEDSVWLAFVRNMKNYCLLQLQKIICCSGFHSRQTSTSNESPRKDPLKQKRYPSLNHIDFEFSTSKQTNECCFQIPHLLRFLQME